MSQVNPLQGLWIPLVTPFLQNEIDHASLENLTKYFADKQIGGFVLSATTGEGQTLSMNELTSVINTVAHVLQTLEKQLPVYVGISGSDPVKLVSQIQFLETVRFEGYLLSGPNYLRPSQAGLTRFVEKVAECTRRNIILYNIPYRTGINIENETMLGLASLGNIIGVKDCCANPDQSYELIRSAPDEFSVMTGEDPFFFNAIANGAPGAIVTGAHVLTDAQLKIIELMKEAHHSEALAIWNRIAHIPGVLFAEPNPAPLKYWLWRDGLIQSPDVRIPFVPISEDLAERIDRVRAECVYRID